MLGERCSYKTLGLFQCRRIAHSRARCWFHRCGQPTQGDGQETDVEPVAEAELSAVRKTALLGCKESGWSAGFDDYDHVKLAWVTIRAMRSYSVDGCTTRRLTVLLRVKREGSVTLLGAQPSREHLLIKELVQAIAARLGDLPWVQPGSEDPGALAEHGLPALEVLLVALPRVARQLEHRHADRTTLIVEDEYDVQDLLHALLRVSFADVRDEEWTPSYAASSTRMDFLLPEVRTVVEVKVASARLRDKAVGEQLLLDCAHYRSHPGCDRLYCFVFDPGGFITNPAGLEADLVRESRDEFTVHVVVAPRS